MGSHALALLAALEVGANPDAPGAVATATGCGIAVVLMVGFNVVFRHVLTAVHEGGHALAFALFGGGVAGVLVEREKDGRGRTVSTGLTVSKGPLGWLDGIVAGAIGYLAAPLAGLLGAVLLGHGLADTVLWVSAAGFALLGLVTKNWFGRFTIFGSAFAFFLLAKNADSFTTLVVACTWVWMLVLGGLQTMLDHWWRAVDFEILQKKTWIPELVWAASYVWLIVVIAILAGLVLVGAKDPYL